MHFLEEKAALEALRKMGFSVSTIRQLQFLRSQYGRDERDQAALDERYLAFARWLLMHGKLTEGNT